MRSLYESIFDTDFEPTVDNTKVQPRSRKEIVQIIDEHIKKLKPKPGDEVDLNWIDISRVVDLSEVFMNTNYIPIIDTWKIDHVKSFNYMFAGNAYITRSPISVLQEKLLTIECYRSMFCDCTALKVAPKLPAKKLTYCCYFSMFAGCTSLETAPELPAENLTEECYWGMFEGCTSLQVAPALPAKKLGPWCYSHMFDGCTSLQVAPELPAKTLEPYCYYNMFAGCKSLTKVPALPAKKLETGCYEDMFKGCPCENK